MVEKITFNMLSLSTCLSRKWDMKRVITGFLAYDLPWWEKHELL